MRFLLGILFLVVGLIDFFLLIKGSNRSDILSVLFCCCISITLLIKKKTASALGLIITLAGFLALHLSITSSEPPWSNLNLLFNRVLSGAMGVNKSLNLRFNILYFLLFSIFIINYFGISKKSG